jgi:hypothetical protein
MAHPHVYHVSYFISHPPGSDFGDTSIALTQPVRGPQDVDLFRELIRKNRKSLPADAIVVILFWQRYEK